MILLIPPYILILLSKWSKQTLEECVLNSTSPECHMQDGDAKDFAIVSELLRVHSLKNNQNVCLVKNFTSYSRHSLFQPYFCGMDVECPTHNSRWSLNRAIENVEKHFPVVGVLEDLDITLKLMQKALPTFFPGIWDAYRQHIRK